MREIKKKATRAQLEIMGLVIIVIIIITGLLIFLVSKVSSPPKNFQKAYMTSELATNMLLAMTRVNIRECPDSTLGELITDCARPTPSRRCLDYTSCEIINKTINEILNNTLVLWDVKFRFALESPYRGVFLSVTNRECGVKTPGKQEGFALLSLYPLNSSVELKLGICD